jgi:hypothetical protein
MLDLARVTDGRNRHHCYLKGLHRLLMPHQRPQDKQEEIVMSQTTSPAR